MVMVRTGSSLFLNTLILEMHNQFKIIVMHMKPDFGIWLSSELKESEQIHCVNVSSGAGRPFAVPGSVTFGVSKLRRRMLSR